MEEYVLYMSKYMAIWVYLVLGEGQLQLSGLSGAIATGKGACAPGAASADCLVAE